ncbi:DUF441 domain-containing protein [Cronobacter dublinensis]|nr:DUF441 domain-containing protein [Cronobacter dublinensis]
MFDITLLILLALAGLGFVSHNMAVTVSVLVLIVIRMTPLSAWFPWVEKQGVTVGIIILTISVMAPIASGTLPTSTLFHAFLNWKSLVAIAVGIFVSWLGGKGVALMGSQPSIVAGLLVGTVIGVALFRGVPVGPLIAAGLVSLLIGRQ